MLHSSTIPADVGLGLKPQHYRDILETNPDIGWFEVHPENYMGDGGIPHYFLQKIRESYPLSLHGVGMSLASADAFIDPQHLHKLKVLIDRYEPGLISEHLAWSHWNEAYLADLLPIPYGRESLAVVLNHLDQVQTYLQRKILVENPATYLSFQDQEFTEADFIGRMVAQSGCGLLLDVNNIYISSVNHCFDAGTYLRSLPLDKVGEIHVAGFQEDCLSNGERILIDSHGSEVRDPVWDLLGEALELIPHPVPILIEWDNNVPDFHVLLEQAKLARNFTLQQCNFKAIL